jgi:ubiquinone/menaquinone biosynthesis C-methylase UbiE
MTDKDAAFQGPIPEIYDRGLGPTLFEPFAQEMAARFRGFEGALLETAAGTGRVTRALAAAVGPNARIVATDLNEPMLAKAAALTDAANVEWRQADGQTLPFSDRAFDAVVCQFGVMFYPDKAAGYAEAHRVLKPGGRYVFSVWDDLAANDLSAEFQKVLDDLFPESKPSFIRRTPFGHHDRETIRTAMTTAGFASVEMDQVERPTPAASTAEFAMSLCLGSPLRAELESLRPGQLQPAAEGVAAKLVERFGPGPVVGHGQALVVTGVR